MTHEEEMDLLCYSDFLPEKMREAKITADRENCRKVLGAMIIERHRPWNQWRVNLTWLCEMTEVDGPECQDILSELVNVRFAAKYGERYVLSDEFVAAWDLCLTEADFGK